MKYITSLLIIIVFTIVSGSVIAENTQFKQQILPIDCLYEVVDVGTQKVRYITPETCLIDPGPPVVTEPSITQPPVTDVGNASEPTKKTIYGFAMPPVTVRPPNDIEKTGSDINNSMLPQLAGVIERIIQNKDIVYLLSAIVIASWALLLISIYKKQRQQD